MSSSILHIVISFPLHDDGLIPGCPITSDGIPRKYYARIDTPSVENGRWSMELRHRSSTPLGLSKSLLEAEFGQLHSSMMSRARSRKRYINLGVSKEMEDILLKDFHQSNNQISPGFLSLIFQSTILTPPKCHQTVQHQMASTLMYQQQPNSAA